MTFGTAINCMDGRTQVPINEYLRSKFGVKYVDTITEPGPNGILAKQENKFLVESILSRVDISINKHGSRIIVIVGHHDCAGNPGDRNFQDTHTKHAMEFLKEKYPECNVVGVYVDEKWEVHELQKSL